MDEELRQHLRDLRRHEATEHDQYAEAARRGRVLLGQFVEEMQRLGVPPYTIVDYGWEDKTITEKRSFGRTSTRQEKARSIQIVDYGWTVGYPISYDAGGPQGLLTGVAVTLRGVLVNADWQRLNSGHGDVPGSAVLRWLEESGTHLVDWILVGAGAQTGQYVGNSYDAKRVSELIYHYSDLARQ
ncbi:hypothetical protein HZU40_22470 [Mycolicibacterium fluoranthenivorans]|uniref:Uncharacterized protein n=1 Tax=Mycolicibacterium fluoranthenivorans TaxID=258505 RepID=A0A7G8P9G4_9MYCO|nr:hypothetical protein [Mycolicibacterium fluoranthenivorans]QNJ90980.1 hypothetical protein HZU40_22470 [Mycolicibacterium fluoranthenivorans]